MLPQRTTMTFEEFLEYDAKSDEQLEFLEGEIFLKASPNTAHQRISRKLSTQFDLYFRGKSCEPFVAPFDILLTCSGNSAVHKVIPDLSVICDKTGLGDKNYSGIPTLIVEILSPSTAWVDIGRKLELYQSCGVKEYWILSPKNRTAQLFSLNEEGFYDEPSIFTGNDSMRSVLFSDLVVELEALFN